MSKRHEGDSLTFTVFHEAWYASAQPNRGKEIMVSLTAEGGGTSGEFAFRWHDLGSELAPRLEAFNDSWSAIREITFRTCGRFLEGLAEMDGTNPSPEVIANWLKSLGFEDRTERDDPRPAKSFACPCCGSPVKVAP